MAIFRGSGSSLTGSAIDPTEALLDSDFTVNGILIRTASGVYSTTPDNTANWDTAYSWGDWSVGVDKSFVDGLNVDADTLDSQEGTWYQDRTNHTGTQTLSTISDSGTAASADVTTSAIDATAGRAMAVPFMGVGGILDLRNSTPNSAAPPSDWLGLGTLSGFANGGTGTNGLNIPGLTGSFEWGVLTVHGQWDSLPNQNTNHAVSREFVKDNRQWLSYAIDSTTWSDWQRGYTQNNILGTVSQSSGVPTGAIIEQGSNSNGEYTKFADGTMICAQDGLSATYDNADFLLGTWTYPAAFAATPQRIFCLTPSVGDGASVFRKAGECGRAGTGTSSSDIRVSAIVGSDWVSGDEVTAISGYAIGRWF